MKISYNWLREYIDLTDSAAGLAEKLTMAGIEVEEVRPTIPEFGGVIVGYVGSVKKHPNADRLSLCEVEIPGETVSVVCGAPNVAPGQHIPFAPAGTSLPIGITLKKAKIRGYESNGMICSEEELGLADKSEGIWVLPDSWEIGADVYQIIKQKQDYILDLSITPNRPDAMSVVGIAREIAAINRTSFRYPEINFKEIRASKNDSISVEIESADGCPRYTARVIKNVRIGTSPEWMRERLKKAGIRPINNIVDITNYVLLELGQPLHAFDLHRISAKKIIVRDSRPAELFTTLDDKERTLPPNTVMICDAERSIAIGGIMGGINSEVSEDTKDILLESAYFTPSRIGVSSKKLGLFSEASQRFERGVDPNAVIRASDRAAALMAELAGGIVTGGIQDNYIKKIDPVKVPLRTERVNIVLGTKLSSDAIRKILNSLNISYSGEMAEIPTFRPDLEREIDLIEEIARLTGFDNIPTKESTNIGYDSGINRDDVFYDFIRSEIRGLGYSEVITNSMMQAREINRIGDKEAIRILNPVSDDMNILRRSLLPGLLKAAAYNINRNMNDLRLFEIGRVFLEPDPDKPEAQPYKIAGLICGNRYRPGWSTELLPVDYYDVKGFVEAFFSKIFLDNLEFILYDNDAYFEHDEMVTVKKGDQELGRFGKVQKKVCDIFDISSPVYAFEFSVQGIQMFFNYKRFFKPYSRFPFVEKDVAFIINNDVAAEDIRYFIEQSSKPLLNSVEIFDVYSGDRLPESRKSIAFRLRFLSAERTLNDTEVNGIFESIIRSVNSKFQAKLREG